MDKELTDYHCGLQMKENEVHDVFKTLDMHKNGYLTSEEIEFFLNIIGEKPFYFFPSNKK